MRFKFFALAAVILVAVFGFGLNANAQHAEQADGLTFDLVINASMGYSKSDDDAATRYTSSGQPVNEGKGDFEFDKFTLEKGTSLSIHGKKGHLSAFGILACGGTQYPDANTSVVYLDGLQVLSFWGKWTSDSGFSIKVGKSPNPANMSGNLDIAYTGHAMTNYTTYDFNPMQICAQFKGFYLAGVNINASFNNVAPDGIRLTTDASTTYYQYDRYMPKIVVGYKLGGERGDSYAMGVHFQYHEFKLVDEGGDNTDGAPLDGERVKAWRTSADFKMKDIAGMLDFLATGYYGINSRQLGMTSLGKSLSTRGGTAYVYNNKLEDASTIGGSTGLTINFASMNNKLALAAGYEQSKRDKGYTKADQDMTLATSFWFGGLDKNFFIVPSYIYKDHMKNVQGLKEGKEQAFGLEWIMYL